MEGTKKFGGDNMPKFEVLIMETLEKVVTVEADNEDGSIRESRRQLQQRRIHS